MSDKEIELSYLVEILDSTGLNQANSSEHQLQFEYKLPPLENGDRRGKVRIRKTTTTDGKDLFEETIKLPIDPSSTMGDFEKTVEIDESYFKAWSKLYKVSGQSKQRYDFVLTDIELNINDQMVKIPKFKFEVDIFYNTEGKRSKFAKVDIEVQSILDYLKENHTEIKAAQFKIDFNSALPIKIGEVISFGNDDPEERAKIKAFFDHWSVPPL